MKTTLRLLLVSSLALGGLAACNKGDDGKKNSAAVVETEKLGIPTKPDAGQEEGEPMLAYDRKRKVLIGGCREDCKDHKTTFQNYIRALAKRDKGKTAIPYLETSEMIYGGEKLGAGWVELWREGQMKERGEQIDAFAAESGAWIDKVDDDALEKALAVGIEYDEDDDPGYLVYFRHPAYEGDDTAPVWRYRIQERGWEWLISSIEYNPEQR